MTFSAAILAEHLAELEAVAGRPARYVIAFSGGLDSTVLAHAIAQLVTVPVLAIHVDHGMQAESARWSAHCAATTAALELEFRALRVNVQTDTGKGPEAAARDARYAALLEQLQMGDWLLSAHHREDQAETLLLNLIRGSGPAGVAGIGELRRFGPGWLARPMLNVNQADIRAYASEQGLQWIEDPSNAELRFDRNFLRHEVLPRLQSRWPDIATRLQRSAGHAGEASQLLIELAAIDLEFLAATAARLPLDKLATLSAARQRNVIRHALRELGLATPTTAQLQRILYEVIPARVDAQPQLSWPGASVRRYRNSLYLLPENLAEAIAEAPVCGEQQLLGVGLGTLLFEPEAEIGIDPALFQTGLTLKPRRGGEEIQPQDQQHRRKLKKLLQEEAIVPWMRDRVPLLYSGEQLVAVGDLWLAADAAARPGVAVRWIGRPALH